MSNPMGSAPGKVPTTPQEYLLESERITKLIMERLDHIRNVLAPVSVDIGSRVQQGGPGTPETLNLSPLASMAKINFQNMVQISESLADIMDRIQL